MRALPVLLLLLGCASGGPSARGATNELGPAEIAAAGDRTTLDVVRQRRPQWLRLRGPTNAFVGDGVVVYVDGMRRGGVRALAQIQASSVARMRFYSAREAQTRWGMGHVNGAIEVVTRDF